MLIAKYVWVFEHLLSEEQNLKKQRRKGRKEKIGVDKEIRDSDKSDIQTVDIHIWF